MGKLQTFAHITLDVQVPHNPITIGVQGDTGRWLDCYLTDNGKPIDLTGLKVRIMAIRPDQNIKQADQFTDGVITEPTNGRCQFEMKSNILGAAGYANVQVFIMEQENQHISTPIFQMQIQTSLYGASAVEGSNEYGAVVIMFQDFYEAKALMIQNIEQMEAISKRIGTEQDFSAIDPSAKNLAQAMKSQYDMNKNALQNSSVSGVLNRIGNYNDDTNLTLMGKANNQKEMLLDLQSRQDLFLEKMPTDASSSYQFSISPNQTQSHTFTAGSGYFYAVKFVGKGSISTLRGEITINGVTHNITNIPDYFGLRRDGEYGDLAGDNWCGFYFKLNTNVTVKLKNTNSDNTYAVDVRLCVLKKGV